MRPVSLEGEESIVTMATGSEPAQTPSPPIPIKPAVCFACGRTLPEGMERNISKTFGTEVCNPCFETGRHTRKAKHLQIDIDKTTARVNYHVLPGQSAAFVQSKLITALTDMMVSKYTMDIAVAKKLAENMVRVEIRR